MAGRLRGGIPRLYGNHRTPKGRKFRQEYLRIVQVHGQEVPEVFKLDVAMVADLFAQWMGLAAQVAELEQERRTGKGRRPSEQRIVRLMKRKELTRYSYQSAREKLEARLAAARTDLNPFFDHAGVS